MSDGYPTLPSKEDVGRTGTSDAEYRRTKGMIGIYWQHFLYFLSGDRIDTPIDPALTTGDHPPITSALERGSLK